jgi:hypothetical protein
MRFASGEKTKHTVNPTMVSVLLSKLYRLNQSLRVRDNRPAGPRLKPM